MTCHPYQHGRKFALLSALWMAHAEELLAGTELRLARVRAALEANGVVLEAHLLRSFTNELRASRRQEADPR